MFRETDHRVASKEKELISAIKAPTGNPPVGALFFKVVIMKNQRPPAYPFFHAAQSRWREVQGRWGLTWGMRRLLHALGITLFLLPISSAHQVSAVPDHAVIEFDREALQRASLQPGTAPASDSLSMAPPTSIAIHNVAHVGSPLLPGGAVAYTITTAYAHTALLTNVVVTDSIPSGPTLVPGSAKPAQSSGPDPLVWSLGSNTPDVPGNKPPEFYCKASTLLPVLQDAWIQADNPDQVKNDDEFRIRYDSDPARHRRGLLQFDLASLPAGATITAADFYLNVKQTADHTVTIQALTSGWDETQVTWNDRLTTTPWGTPGGDLAGSYGSFAPSANGYLSADVTSLVQGWVAGSNPNEGIILVPTAGADSESKYDSSIVPGKEPYIRMQYQALQASPAIGNALDAMPRLITSGTGITVTMRLTATQDTSNVAPSTLVITGTNGVGASCTGPSPTPPRTVYSNTVTTYTWYCDTKAPGNIGTLTFGAEASDSGAVSWPWAQSNSVIVVPPLTFEVTLDIQLKPSIFEVRNTAWADSDQQIQPVSASAYYPILGVDLDFGDLPDSNYATLLLINGARHVTSGLFLGAMVDPEVEGQPGPGASGDGSDDDGLVRSPADAWQPGNTVRIEASVSGGPGRLAAWYDWNGDGDFEDTGEFLDHGDISGTQTLSVTIPNDGSYVVGDPLYTRFRLFDPVDFPGGNLDAGDYAGLAIGGEVEDYYWAFGPTVVSLTSFAALPENPFLVVGRMTLPGLSMLLTFGVLHLRRRLRKSG